MRVTGPDAETRQQALAMQKLHIELLFCERTRSRWLRSPDDVLAANGLPAEAKSRFADITSEQFQAECHGRRVLVERTIGAAFPKTSERLAARKIPLDPRFDDFLCSEYFFDPRFALPHVSGVGTGYENISKYFFWLRQNFHLASGTADAALREAAYTEFAAWLLKQYLGPHDPWFDRFKGGIFWPQTLDKEIPVTLLSDKGVIFTVSDRDTIKQLPQIGLVSLDDLQPPDIEENDMLA